MGTYSSVKCSSFNQQFMEEYPPMIMNTVRVLGADNVSPAEACTAFECIYMLFYFKQGNCELLRVDEVD